MEMLTMKERKIEINKDVAVDANSLVEQINLCPFILSFSGQGFDWISMLRSTLKDGVQNDVKAVIAHAAKMLEPVVDQLDHYRPDGFAPVLWAQSSTVHIDLLQAAVSVPGIFVSQIANLKALQKKGLNIESATGCIGHSQGILGCYLLNDLSQVVPLLAIAELIGVAASYYGKANNMVIKDGLYPMVMIQNFKIEDLQLTIDTLFPEELTDDLVRPCVGLINSRSAAVITGQPEAVKKVCDALVAELPLTDNQSLEHIIFPLEVEVAFHHPSLSAAVAQVVDWAETCGIDSEQAGMIARHVLIEPVNWVKQCQHTLDQGAAYILEIGPSGGVAALTEDILKNEEITVLDISGEEGKERLFDK